MRKLPKMLYFWYMRKSIYVVVLLAAFSLTQCGPNLQEVEIKTVLEHDGAWHDIMLKADGSGYAVGGDTWRRGDVARTNDYGDNWTVQTITDKGMYGLDISGDNKVAVGIDGQIMVCDEQDEWKKWRTPFWEILLDLKVHPTASYAIAVGGQRFKKGVIKSVRTTDFSVLHFDTLDKGLETVIHLEGDRWLAAGFGVVLHTQNGGADWDISYPDEAHFTSLHQGEDGTIWMGSQYGGLWRSNDNGRSWLKLHSVQTAFSARQFRDITQDEEGVLWLGGDRGTLAYSINAGADLNYLKISDEYDIRAISVVAQHIFMATQSGEIISVRYPEGL